MKSKQAGDGTVWETELYPGDDGDSTELAQELFDKGLIFAANEGHLHRYGYALGVDVAEDGKTVTGLSLHRTSDPDGIWFDEKTTVAGRTKMREAGLLRPRPAPVALAVGVAAAEVDNLLGLILDEMPGATNRDLAADGPVGNEEESVWTKIEESAERLRSMA